jgi:hypothetical protein
MADVTKKTPTKDVSKSKDDKKTDKKDKKSEPEELSEEDKHLQVCLF